MLEGPQRGIFDLTFDIPSACARTVLEGRADVGIVPVAALLERDLAIFRGTGIASRGAVRTILLISKRPFHEIEVLAADSSSRSSVLLSRIILEQVYSSRPALISMPPRLRPMLEAADAALIIGDSALVLDPDELRAQGLRVNDLGAEWFRLTGLPMVFAVWAGRESVRTPVHEAAFVDSCRFGLEHLDEIVVREHAQRGISVRLARQYLTENLVLELGETEYRGMGEFLRAASELPPPRYLEISLTRGERLSV
jgi:chorismate dehydratase